MKEIYGFPEYCITRAGEVFSNRRNYVDPKEMKQHRDKSGYLYVRLFRGKKRHWRHVHRLVLDTFIGLRRAGQQARHLDGNKDNNVITNLQWGTPKENYSDRMQHGSTIEGARNSQALLTEKQVLEIRKTEEPSHIVAKKFGVSSSAVRDIRNGRSWKHLK